MGDSNIMYIDLGPKIREARKAKKLTIASLARMSEVSEGMISQIERNMVVPSAVILWKLSKALDRSISYFFGEEGLADDVVLCRKGEHKRIDRSNEKGYFELLTPKGKRQIEMIKVVIFPGNTNISSPVVHTGEECGIVIQGKLTVEVNNKKYYLEEGDSIQFDSNMPHEYLNESDKVSISIWAEQPYTW